MTSYRCNTGGYTHTVPMAKPVKEDTSSHGTVYIFGGAFFKEIDFPHRKIPPSAQLQIPHYKPIQLTSYELTEEKPNSTK